MFLEILTVIISILTISWFIYISFKNTDYTKRMRKLYNENTKWYPETVFLTVLSVIPMINLLVIFVVLPALIVIKITLILKSKSQWIKE
jgi:hypothetical protein